MLSKTFRAALLVGAAVGCVATLAGPSFASTQSAFSVARQPLGDALLELSRSSGRNILFSPAAVGNRTGQAISNAGSLPMALDQLLAGSGLIWRASADGSITVTQDLPSTLQAPSAGQSRIGDVNDAVQVDDVIVTAQKRQEAIEDVPAAVTVVSGEDIRERGISDFTGLVDEIPGVSINYAFGGAGYGLLSIRGAGGADDYKPNGNPSVALHVDGVYQTSNAYLGLPLFDLERLEILKGPQGTLYGRNSTAGVINAITQGPEATFEGSADVRVGNFGFYGFEAAAGGPLSDTVGLRLAVFGEYGGGFMDGQGAGTLAGFRPIINGVVQTQVPGITDPGPREGFGDKDQTAARATLTAEFAPGSRFTLKAFASRDRGDTRQYDRIEFSRDPANVGGIRLNPGENADPYEFFSAEYFRQSIDVRGVTGEFVQDLDDGLTLTVLGGLQSSERSVGGNGDGTPYPQGGQFLFEEELSQASIEARVANDPSGRLDWIAGVFAVTDDVDFDSTWTSFNARTVYQSPYAQSRRSAAVFGQVKIDLTERLALNGGLRLTSDNVTFKGRNIDLNPWGISRYQTTFGTSANFSWDRDFQDENLSGRAALQYDITDALQAFVAYGTGYRSGGFDGTSIFTPEETAPILSETVTSWEGGLRYTTGRLRATFDVFRNEYEDLQATTRLSNDTNGRTNVGAAWTEGVELSLQLDLIESPGQSLDVSVAAAWLESEITEFRSNRVNDVLGTIGDPLPGAPDVTANLTLNHQARFGRGLALTTRLSVSHHGEESNRLNALPDNTVEPYTLVNMRTELRSDNGWAAYAYARNLTDEVYFPELNGASRLVGAPRTYGLGLRREF